MVDHAWLLDFPHCTASFLPFGLSDHSPCIVTFCPSSTGKTPWRFFNMWAGHDEFLSIVDHNWNSIITGNSKFQLRAKLKLLKSIFLDKRPLLRQPSKIPKAICILTREIWISFFSFHTFVNKLLFLAKLQSFSTNKKLSVNFCLKVASVLGFATHWSNKIPRGTLLPTTASLLPYSKWPRNWFISMNSSSTLALQLPRLMPMSFRMAPLSNKTRHSISFNCLLKMK